VSDSGASAGAVLCGFGLNNQGVRLQVLQAQGKGNGGPLQGPFVILDVGDNMHSDALAGLRHRPTDAAEVLTRIRQNHPGCVNIANASILTVEAAPEPGRPPRGEELPCPTPTRTGPDGVPPPRGDATAGPFPN
jgi:hypothetical protein